MNPFWIGFTAGAIAGVVAFFIVLVVYSYAVVWWLCRDPEP